ncbi:MAG: TRAP transporter small permease subunit [Proteobacteria bacterium]|nr:TRAP transporter small permease subunit [Pseudomonadota bacterium]
MAHDMDTLPSDPNRGTGPVHTVLRGIVWIGQAAAWLIVPILILVMIGVTLSAAKIGTIFRWENDVFLFGSKLTLASIGDLQWHLFGIMLMLTMAGAIINDRHVRVDFLRQNFSEKTKNIIEVIGFLSLLAPLCVIVVLHGYDFTVRSFNMGEGSDYDGMYDRFVVKAFVPIGFGLMLIAGLGLTIQKLRMLFGKGNIHD